MKTPLKSSLPVAILLISLTFLIKMADAQQVTPGIVCSGGETLSSNGLYLNFTIGDISTSSLTGSGYLLTQGFLQGPGDNTAVEETKLNEDNLIIYPNPVTKEVNIICTDPKRKPVKADIKDLTGKVVLIALFHTGHIAMDLQLLTPGFYLTTIYFKDQHIITKKIIKQ